MYLRASNIRVYTIYYNVPRKRTVGRGRNIVLAMIDAAAM